MEVQDSLGWLSGNILQHCRAGWLGVAQMVEKEVEEAKASPQPPIDYLWKCAPLHYSPSEQCAHTCP